MDLWIEKHRPRSLEEVVGNRKPVGEVKAFVEQRSRGKALLVHGQPGVGKTLSVQLAAAQLGFDLLQIAAADERGKEALASYASVVKTRSLFHKGRVILIDEVDALSGRDRGAAKAVIDLIKASHFPVILIANDPYHPKLRSLRRYCSLVKFSKVPSPSVEKRLREVCDQEGVEVEEGVLKALARFSEGDLRSALLDLQTAVSQQRLTMKDLERVGFRERASAIFNSLPTLFRSGRVETGRKLLWESDQDPDEVFWWLENNAHLEFQGERLARALDVLAKANVMRGRVIKNQQWALKGYMVDLMAGVSVFSEGGYRYVPYKAPDRFIHLGRTKARRAALQDVCSRLGRRLHCSPARVRKDYLPYLKMMLETSDLNLDPEDVEVIVS